MASAPGILLVDDDQTILTMYSDYLRLKGFRVFSEDSGTGALACLIQAGNDIDLVVTDIMMASMNGWDFLDYIRKELKLDEVALPVIVMSAVESIELDMEYIRHRANDWVTKPIKPLAKLVLKIQALLGLDLGKDLPHACTRTSN